ncbi:MAG TPA: phosphoribosylformylglycinamidine synthase subunit PurL [Chthoniobacterales bacterium]|jgi:phosphoribosylformylglycinamidine synthase|nr:phosphoribosylformylglycinamidine synthase subunit PurL [Chthoniobacterales bacterium]
MTSVTIDPPVTPEMVERHGLTPEEFERIKKILGREPNLTELGIFSVMWSEHCSYKNSRKELKKFPTSGPNILVKAGEENAGVVDIGDGWAVAFKIESHNHPSAIEPFQGAATGVGGIIRDIFTMGARPEFCLNSLRFGPITDGDTRAAKPQDRHSQIAANRSLFTGVVSGIAHYGNCVGVPTIGGEIYFDESFEGNPLVNVFCLGVLRHEQLARGAARGVGNPVFYVGAETGRDGLAGAAFASRELTEESRQDRPAVQVGDPFKEKLLLEACLELLARDAVAGIQDMGAAGLTCSTCETASRGGSGIEIDLAKVPKREPGMTPYEILLSESQERMLIIAKRGKENVVREIFEKWDVPCAEIGCVTDDGVMRVRNNGSIAAEIPAKPLAEQAPLYSRDVKPPSSVATVYDRRFNEPPKIDNHQALRQLLRDPTIASKNWVYRQYDHTVRTGTVVKPGSDAAVFHVKYANKILAATTDCNSFYCRLDPREGGKIAVAEAARNLTCSGAKPLAITDNLNFGNPYKPENFWQLREAVEGIAEACRAFGTPVTGGNVSLYNESPAGVVDSTPTVAMVGLIDKEEHITTQWFEDAGDAIILVGAGGGVAGPASPNNPKSAGVGDPGHSLGGSQFLRVCYGRKEGPPPRVDLELEIDVQNAVRDLIREGLVKSAHDCSEGGLAVALAECCFNPDNLLGADVDFENCGGNRSDCAGDTPASTEEALFNESQSRIVISVARENLEKTISFLRNRGVPFERLGEVGGDELRIRASNEAFRWPISDLYDDWFNAIRRAVASDSAAERIPSL